MQFCHCAMGEEVASQSELLLLSDLANNPARVSHGKDVFRQASRDDATGADGTIAFFKLDGGLLLGLYERANLAKDASLPPGPPSSTEFSLGVPAASQAEVDELLRHVEAAGGTLTASAHMRPFGVYSGYFTDPDGHLFEIA